MPRTTSLAGEVRRHYGVRGALSDDVLDQALAASFVRVIETPLAGRVREMCYDRCIVIRPGLPRDLRRWLICHAYWHIMLGFANHAYLDEFDPVLRRRDERDAEKFAGWLLLGEHLPRSEPWATAAAYDVPEDRLRRWYGLVNVQ